MDATGGLYSPVLFKEFTAKVPPFMKKSYMEYFTRTRPWHGAPIAALRRVIASLGSLRIAAFSDETLNDLELLRNLIFIFLKTTTYRISPPPHRLRAMTGAPTSVPPPEMMNIPMREEIPLAAAPQRSVAPKQL